MLEANSKFQIVINCHICNDTQKIIRYLYQPIIGSAATALYFMLLTEKTSMQTFNLDNTHLRIQNLLQLSLSEIEVARHKLEAVGLLDVFLNEETMFYYYEILPPLVPVEFYKNEKFNQLLINSLSENDYERTYFLFMKHNVELTNYQKITKDFHEIFNPANPILSTTTAAVEPDIKGLLETDEAVSTTKVKQFQINTPETYLIALKKMPLSKQDQFLLNKLKDYQLKSEVINCLLAYVWYKNKQVLVLAYLEKIADSLQAQGIDSAELAMEYLRRAYAQSLQKNKKRVVSKKIAFKPKLNYQLKWNEGIIPNWLKEPTNYQT